jgi:hypothetical protein
MKQFFWLCSGADMAILRTWDCSTEHNTYAGIGATIFLTAVLASLSGGYALWTVFQSSPYAITFGILWGILIFNWVWLFFGFDHGAGHFRPLRIIA